MEYRFLLNPKYAPVPFVGLKASRKFPGKFPKTWKVSTAKFPEKFGNSERKK